MESGCAGMVGFGCGVSDDREFCAAGSQGRAYAADHRVICRNVFDVFDGCRAVGRLWHYDWESSGHFGECIHVGVVSADSLSAGQAMIRISVDRKPHF